MPDASPVRKRVTVLFSDVAGSTALGESLDAEALLRLMSQYFEAMRAVIEAHGGQVAKFIGDAVMAVFGIPSVREDDALRAVRAAAEMRERLGELNENLKRDQGLTIGVRTGINTGEVLAGIEVGEALALGDPVNVAARLEQAASTGEILLGETTYALVRDAVRVEELELTVKGKSRPVAAYRLLEVAAHRPGVSRRLSAPLVGRREELAALERAFGDTVNDKTCRLITVVGEAGMGKSRLAAEFVAGVDRSALVIEGRCLSYGQGITFWPLAEAVKQAAGIRQADEVAEAVRKIEALLPEGSDANAVARHLATAAGLIEGAFVLEEAFWATRRLFESLADERPLVAVFDDIHWAEPSFLDLLEYLRGFSSGRPILLLCQARPDLFDRRPEWRAGSNGFVIRLGPLSREQSGQVIDHLLADGRLELAARDRIAEVAEGNPLFVEEILRTMADRAEALDVAEVGVETLDIPPTIHALLDARLEGLPAEERSLLQRASVIGKEFWWGAVAQLTPDKERDRLGSLLQTLVRRELIQPQRGTIAGHDAFVFSHLLIRDAAYRGLPKESRAQLHQDVAGWLERWAGDRIAEYQEILGYHLERAFRYRTELGHIGQAERAVAEQAASHLIAAGQRAVVRGDNAAIISLLERASALLEPDDPRRLQVLPDLGDALDRRGAYDRSRSVFLEAISRSEAIGDRQLRAHAAVMYWCTQDVADEAQQEARSALEIFQAAGDELGLSRAWRLLSSVAFELGRGGESDEALEKALDYARRTGHGGELGSVYSLLSMNVTRGPMPVGAGIAMCEDVLARSPDSPWITGAMCHVLAHLRARWGQFEEARELVRRYRETRRDFGWMAAYWEAAEVAGDVEMLAGGVERAVEVIEEAFVRYRELTGEDSEILAAWWLARALYQADRLDDAERIARVAINASPPLSHHLGLGVLAAVLARRGQLEEAEAMAREATAFFEGTDYLTDHATVLLDLAEVLRISGRTPEAADAVRQAVDLYERKEDRVSAGRARQLLSEMSG